MKTHEMINGNDPMPYVYVKSIEHAWVPARVLQTDCKHAKVVVQKYKDEQEMLLNTQKTSGLSVRQETVTLSDYENNVLPMQNTDDRGKLGNYEDMVNLPYLHEAAILYNIKNRHDKGLPYTRTGDMVCAVNPYQWIDSLYTEKKRKLYAQRLVWENSEDDRSSLAPHVYETSALSYRGMAFDNQDQSILVSGESGAGKTETVKICMNQIATVQEGPCFGSGTSKGASLIVQRVLDSNPLLEAFGNAKTRRNDNSSRFGKYVQLQFERGCDIGRPEAKLAGSKCDVYLLEKNRVVSHDDKERTFHIFYQLLAAPEDTKKQIWDGLVNTTNESFKYVGRTDANKIEGVTDGDQFQRTMDVLGLIGLGDSVKRDFLRAICVVLQLGNLSYVADRGNDDKSVISSQQELKDLASLMDIPEANLSTALTERTMKTKDETYKVPLNPAMASDSSDALAKEIYGSVFLWLVKAINKATCAEENYAGGSGRRFGVIGLLDIFGFESFNVNRFEQLCINYANEKLQQKFTEDIFRSVQAEYKMEGIPLDEIKYDDNSDVLDLIEGRNGLCALLNEECVRPKGSGEGFVNKALAGNRKSSALLVDKMDRLSFGINHYAGNVFYCADNFVTANIDTLPTDLAECATMCSNPIISKAFMDDETQHESSPRSGAPKRGKSNIVALTVWTKYKNQLSQLMTNLRSTRSQYIRCIKPNTIKKPLLMEHQTTIRQLRYAGIVAAVTISRSAFPNRLQNSTVYARYNSMWDKKRLPSIKTHSQTIQEQIRADCEAVLSCVLKCKEVDGNRAFVVGKTRCYFRAGALEYLESQRITGLDAQATAIQKAVRGWLVRRYLVVSAKNKQEQNQQVIREEQERQERLAREAQERQDKFEEEIAGYESEIAALKKQLQQSDDATKISVREAEERTKNFVKERGELEQKTNELVETEIEAFNRELEHFKTKLECNTKLISYLRKENMKVNKTVAKDDKVLSGVEENNKLLSDRNEQYYSAYDDLDDSHRTTKSNNEKLLDVWQREKQENADLKEKVRKEQAKYMNVAEQRLEIQKTLAGILNTLQDGCKNQRLVEDVFYIAHSCEAEANCEMTKLEGGEEPDLTSSEVSDSSSNFNL